MNYELLVDKLMQHFTSEPYSAEVDEAKKEFFERAGHFDENSEVFELKMAQFSDWYIFHRPLSSNGLSPIQYVLKGSEFPVEEELLPYYKNLAESVHSLFAFQKLKAEDVYIKDLISGKKYVLKKSPVTLGFNREEIFEARIISHDDNYIFGKAFCFHPSVVSKFILKSIKAVKKAAEEDREAEKENLITRLFKMRYKHEQYKHVDVRKIYSNDSKLRV